MIKIELSGKGDVRGVSTPGYSQKETLKKLAEAMLVVTMRDDELKAYALESTFNALSLDTISMVLGATFNKEINNFEAIHGDAIDVCALLCDVFEYMSESGFDKEVNAAVNALYEEFGD